MVLWRQVLFQCVTGRKTAKFLIPKFDGGSIQTMAFKATVSWDVNDHQGAAPEKQGEIPCSKIEDGKEVISQKPAALKSIDIDEYGMKFFKITAGITAELNHSLKLIKEIEVNLTQDLKAIHECIQFAEEVMQSSQSANENKLELEQESSKQKPISTSNRHRFGVKNKDDMLGWDDEENQIQMFEESGFEGSLDCEDEMLDSYENTNLIGSDLDFESASMNDSHWSGPSDVDFGLGLEETDDRQMTYGENNISGQRSKDESSGLFNEGYNKKSPNSFQKNRPQENSVGSFNGVNGSKKFGQSKSMECHKCGSFGHKSSECSKSSAKGKKKKGKKKK